MPKPISLGENKTVWVKEEILNWVDELKIHSRGFGKKKEGKNV
jgi:predicted DNA-binding transcriptional regulator AlpA